MGTGCWINMGADGTFAATGKLSSTPADIDLALGAGLDGSDRLVLYFHGGLVPEASGLASAERMAANYGKTAASLGIIWETGLDETIRDHLSKITQTRLFRKAVAWVLAKAGFGDGTGKKGAGGTEAQAQAIEAALSSPGGAEALDASLSAVVGAGGPGVAAKGGGADELDAELIAQELEYEFAAEPSLPGMVEAEPEGEPIRRRLDLEEGSKGITLGGVALFIAKVVVAVIRRHRNGTAHDPLPTAVEELLRAAYLAEIGKFAWDDMKSKAKRMWIDDGETPGTDGHVGGYVMRRLEALQARRPELTVDLVGHSAGSIAICELMSAIDASKRRIRFRNIVFLAPAVRLDLFARWIARGPQIYRRFRMFTMTDAAEKADRVGGPIYPRSLLYLVSGCFEDRPDAAILGMDRFLAAAGTSAGTDYDDVRDWLRKEERLVHSPSADGAAQGLRTAAIAHGAFDDDAAVLSSLLHMAGEAL